MFRVCKHIFLTIALIGAWPAVSEAQVEFRGTADKQKVAMGQPFRLSYRLNTIGRNFRMPALQDLQILQGPHQSTSMEITNGNVSQALTFQFVLRATGTGKIVIPPATITVDGREYKSNSVEIEATDGPVEENNAGGAGNSGDNKDDIVLARVDASRSDVFIGEALLLTYRVSSRLPLIGFKDARYPSLNGFMTYDLEQPNQISLRNENLNGITYQTGDLRRQIIFPQRSGNLKLNPLEVECVVREQQSRSPRSFFDQFFGGGYRDISLKATSSVLNIRVKPLPENGKPAGFKGAVGEYQMKAEVDKNSLKTNEAITLKVTLSGNGNLKLLEAPEISFPADFEAYDPKTNESLHVSEAGVTGKMEYEFVLIPRHGGTFTIPSFAFHFFNPRRESYVTLNSPEFSIAVEEGVGTMTGTGSGNRDKEDLRVVGEDIRFIHNRDIKLVPQNGWFFGSAGFMVLLLSPLLLTLFFFFLRKKQQKEEGDAAGTQSRKARKMARSRLSAAARFLKEQKRDAYYEEMLKAVWGYLGHRLRIATADLNRDRITERLRQEGVPDDTIEDLFALVDHCEFARYAPQGNNMEMENKYRQAITIISEIEEKTK